MKKYKIVVSALNTIDGGSLSILMDCLTSLNVLHEQFEIVAIVDDKSIYNFQYIKFIEVKMPNFSWIKRLYYEYFFFRKLSQSLQSDIWLSIRDISPFIYTKVRSVYCHNALPFYNFPLKFIRYDFKSFLHSFLYFIFYKININSNDFIIVQQKWIRDKFVNKLNVDSKKIIISHPESLFTLSRTFTPPSNLVTKIFLYPALPRIWKNIQLIPLISRQLLLSGFKNFEFRLTFLPNENLYSSYIYNLSKDIPNIKFIGRQTKKEMGYQYEQCDVVFFPSELETWGLPISEAKFFLKSLLVVDLPYSRETVGNYNSVNFFDSKDIVSILKIFESILNGGNIFNEITNFDVSDSTLNNWPQIFKLYVNKLNSIQ